MNGGVHSNDQTSMNVNDKTTNNNDQSETTNISTTPSEDKDEVMED